MPGPLDIDPLPQPSVPSPTGLDEGWLGWWHTLIDNPRPASLSLTHPHAELTFSPPDFTGLTAWPTLREIVSHRWMEAHNWHTARKQAGVRSGSHKSLRENQVVAGVERSLGRRVAPFSLDFILLPVRDHEIREIQPTSYLVPEQVYDGPQWVDWLRGLVTRLA
jgi:hypothetical protein